MSTIKVLGTGCHNCIELEKRLSEAITKSGRYDVNVERIDDERTIRHYIPLDAIPGFKRFFCLLFDSIHTWSWEAKL